MKAKRLRTLLLAGLLSMAPSITLTACSGGGGGGGDDSPSTDTQSEDGDSPQTAGVTDYAPSTLKPCKIKFLTAGIVVKLYSNAADIWYSNTQSSYSDGYWNYTKTGVNKGYLTVDNCTQTLSRYPEYVAMKVSLRGEITFSENNEAYWDLTQTIVDTNGKVLVNSGGGSCTITSLLQG